MGHSSFHAIACSHYVRIVVFVNVEIMSLFVLNVKSSCKRIRQSVEKPDPVRTISRKAEFM